MKRLFIMAALFLASGTCSAADWVDLGGSKGVSVHVDRESLHRNVNFVKMWFQFIPDAPTDVPGVHSKKTYRSERVLYIFDCADRTSALMQAIYYAEANGGEVVGGATYDLTELSYKKQASGSIGEVLLVYACQESLFLATGTGNAADWVDVSRTKRVSAQVDRESIHRNGNFVKAWARFTLGDPADVPGVHPKKTFRSLKGLHIFDCADRTFAVMRVIFYAEADYSEVVKQSTYNSTKLIYGKQAPGSTGEALLVYACQASNSREK